jgi:histidine ammonia-lyase
MRIAEWRAIYRGAPISLDPFARADVEAGAAALTEVLAAKALSRGADAPSVAELLEGGGDRLPSALVRLFVALKLGSLGQGMSGVRWDAVDGLSRLLTAELIPAVPANSVNDRLALAHLFAALTGTGEIVNGEGRVPAAKALKASDLTPLELNGAERDALVSGAAFSVAAVLAGLFEAERVLQSALVASALSARAAGCFASPLHPRAHVLHRQPGQLEVAAMFRALSGAGESDTAAAANREAIGESDPFRRGQFAMGGCLDLLRHAAATLERAANAVGEDRLVLWQSGEVVQGIEDKTSLAHAADLIALALRTIAELSLARISALPEHENINSKGDDDRKTPEAQAASFVAGIREQAVSGPVRLLQMAGNVSLVLALELLEATRLCDVESDRATAALEGVLALVREAAPTATEAMLTAGGFVRIAERVRSGALAAAAGTAMPGIVTLPAESPRRA